MKVAVFSPIPPICSEVSEYNEHLLSHLVNYIDFDIFIDNYEPSLNQKTQYRILSHNDFERRNIEKPYKMILYHMANNETHHYMYPYLLKYPGVTILHDYSFHEFFFDLETVAECKDKYLEELKYNYGARAGQLMYRYTNRLWTQIDDAMYPLNRRIIDSSLGIIVYNDTSKREIEKKYLSTNVIRIKKGVPIRKTFFSHKSDAKEKVGIPYDTFVFGVFESNNNFNKIVTVIKGFEKLIRIFNKSTLLFIGYRKDEEINRLITELNIEESVRVIGDVSKENFFDYAFATDIAFSLHMPPTVTSLPGILTLMGTGLPVVMMHDSVFREIPDNCCVKIDTLGEEAMVETLFQAVYPLITDNNLRESICKNAKRFIHENHNIENNAESYHDFIYTTYRKTLMRTNNILKLIKNELGDIGVNERFTCDLRYFEILKKELEFE